MQINHSVNSCSHLISNIEKSIGYLGPIVIFNKDKFLRLTECSDYSDIKSKLDRLGVVLNHKNVFTDTEISIYHSPQSKTIIVSPTIEFRHSEK